MTFNLTVNEYLTLIGIKIPAFVDSVRPELFDDLVTKEYLEFDGYKPVLSKKGENFISRYISSRQRINQREAKVVEKKVYFSDDFITSFRKKFKGLKPGAMGDLSAVTSKMERFFEAHKEATETDILKATDMYLDSLNNYDYLQQADYFIYKQEKSGTTSSRLSVFLEEYLLKKKNGDSDPTGDWTTRLS